MTPRPAVLMMLLAVLPVHFQQRDAPARRDPVGTAVIAGVVTDAQSSTPLRRALVSIAGSELALVRSVISDDEGRFSIGALPAGRYILKASKVAYLTTEFGSKRPGRPGSAIALADGQQMTGVSLRVPRGGVITGTIAEPRGRPARGLQVAIVPAPAVSGPVFAPDPVQLVATDDRGAYRAFGLMPGSYYVVATSSSGSLAVANAITMRDAEVDAALAELQRGRSAGSRPSVPAPSPPVSTVAFGSVFYPGTPVSAEATKVTVAAGEERAGIDFAFAPIPAAMITGSVSSPYGALPPITIALNPAGVRLPLAVSSTSVFHPGAVPKLWRNVATGEFGYTNVTPGQYTIAVQSTTAVSAPRPISGGSAGAATPVADSPTLLWASVDITVTGTDISGLALSLRPAMRVAGRVVFDGRTATPPADLRTLSIELLSTQSAGRIVYSMSTTVGHTLVPPTQVRADGTFESPGLLPGGYRISSVPPRGWHLRSAMLNGRDVLDAPLEIGADRDIAGVVVTFTDQRTELVGTLQTTAGAPAPDYFVVAIPSQQELWRPGSRRVHAARPGLDGRYSIRDLPAGEYLLAALTDVDPAELQDPTFLASIAGGAVKVTLTEGRTTTQDMRLVVGSGLVF